MKIFALLSWFNEQESHLRRCVSSLEGFADVVVALDGAYATFPEARAESPCSQRAALHEAARDAGLAYCLKTPYRAWKGGEVEKRAALFDLARTAGATPDDWFLIIDADMAVGYVSEHARAKLEATGRAVAEQRWHNLQINGVISGEYRMRFMFRALPGLTVERAHYLYTVPNEAGPHGRRFLWHLPDGHPAPEPIVDLFDDVTLVHFNSQREPVRKRQALDYYKARDGAGLEAVGDWR